MKLFEELFEESNKSRLKTESSKGTYQIGLTLSGFHLDSGKSYSIKITDIYVEVRNRKPVAMIEYSLKLDGKSSVENNTAEEFMKTWFGY